MRGSATFHSAAVITVSCFTANCWSQLDSTLEIPTRMGHTKMRLSVWRRLQPSHSFGHASWVSKVKSNPYPKVVIRHAGDCILLRDGDRILHRDGDHSCGTGTAFSTTVTTSFSAMVPTFFSATAPPTQSLMASADRSATHHGNPRLNQIFPRM